MCQYLKVIPFIHISIDYFILMYLLSLFYLNRFEVFFYIKHIDTLTREILSGVKNRVTQYEYVAQQYVSMFRVKSH